jgi:hypothetical protein
MCASLGGDEILRVGEAEITKQVGDLRAMHVADVEVGMQDKLMMSSIKAASSRRRSASWH